MCIDCEIFSVRNVVTLQNCRCFLDHSTLQKEEREELWTKRTGERQTGQTEERNRKIKTGEKEKGSERMRERKRRKKE